MTPRSILLTASLLASLALVAGCKSSSGTAGPAAPVTVRLLAYVNVSSGCQQTTVDFLHSLPGKYPGVQVELVDFGDGGPGATRWEQSGLKCMALEINGQSIVKYPVDGSMKVTAFRAPAGFYWEHADLEAAVQAAGQGTLQPATEEEFLAGGGTAPTQDEVEKYKAERKSDTAK
ncbi:MAG: hypothetical protein KKI08_12240 [Armatimonadetes bacterium]|nr:hypothetical protein [Armatimonadota bacterium]